MDVRRGRGSSWGVGGGVRGTHMVMGGVGGRREVGIEGEKV